MIKLLTVFVFLCGYLAAFAGSDFVILRSGSELSCKIVQVSNEHVIYSTVKIIDDDYKEVNDTIALKDVYLLDYEKRGIVYITAEGKRVSDDGANLKELRRDDINKIYMLSGKVYPAYSLQIFEDRIVFERSKAKGGLFAKKQNSVEMTLPKSEVFMIKYSDGAKDIITEFPKEKEEIKVEVETPIEEEPVEMRQVIFHNVKRGDTLAKLAKRYGVTVDEIKEWNELPEKMTPTVRLQTEMQLMIYVKLVEEEK